MHEPVRVQSGNAVSHYRINVGTIKKIREKTGLDMFSKDEEKSPLSNPVNMVTSIEAIAEPPIDLSEAVGAELVTICENFVEECQRFFPMGVEHQSPTASPTPPSDK